MAVQITPISSTADLKTAINTLNTIIRQLGVENQTKTISQSSGSAIVSGKLTTGAYGEVIYDTNNIARILIGQKSNGEPIIAVSKKNKSVIDLLNK